MNKPITKIFRAKISELIAKMRFRWFARMNVIVTKLIDPIRFPVILNYMRYLLIMNIKAKINKLEWVMSWKDWWIIIINCNVKQCHVSFSIISMNSIDIIRFVCKYRVSVGFYKNIQMICNYKRWILDSEHTHTLILIK